MDDRLRVMDEDKHVEPDALPGAEGELDGLRRLVACPAATIARSTGTTADLATC